VRIGYNWRYPLLSGTHSMQLLERERCLAELAEWLHVPSRAAAVAMARKQSDKEA